jgi:acyl-CoA dehydrogenase
MIADMAIEIEALRSLIYRTAWLVATGQPFIREGSICKVYASEVLHRCVDKAVQIHGGMGYMRDYSIERMYRDARITELFEGTSEIQRYVIAADIFRQEGVRISP